MSSTGQSNLLARATHGKYGAGKHRRKTAAAIHTVAHAGFGARRRPKHRKLAGAVKRIIHDQTNDNAKPPMARPRASTRRKRPTRRWTEEQKLEHVSEQKQARVVQRTRKWMMIRTKAKKEALSKFHELASTGGKTMTIEAMMRGLLPPSMSDEAKLALVKTHADADGDGSITFKELSHFYVPVMVAAEADLVAMASDADASGIGGAPTAEAILLNAMSIFADFDAADVDSDGVLSASKVRHFFTERYCTLGLTATQVDSAMAEHAAELDGSTRFAVRDVSAVLINVVSLLLETSAQAADAAAATRAARVAADPNFVSPATAARRQLSATKKQVRSVLARKGDATHRRLVVKQTHARHIGAVLARFKLLDVTQSRTLTVEQLTGLFGTKHLSAEDCTLVVRAFDTDGDGVLGVAEVQRVCKAWGDDEAAEGELILPLRNADSLCEGRPDC